MLTIHENLLLELFKLCFRKKEIIEICKLHLKYHYLPIESHKRLLKEIIDTYNIEGSVPSIGEISQRFNTPKKSKEEDELRREVLKLLYEIKQVKVENQDSVLQGLEDFIKDSIFIDTYNKLGKLFNSGKKEEVRQLLEEKGKELSQFNLKKNTGSLEFIFKNFNERMRRRALKYENSQQLSGSKKVPFGILALDNCTYGGSNPENGDLDCLLARSGTGKSRWLRFRGTEAARLGKKVLHIQLEGTKEETEKNYDSTWTALTIPEIEKGHLDEEFKEELQSIIDNILQEGGDIAVEAFEQFGKASVHDIRRYIEEYERETGYLPDLVIIDYLELLDPGTGIKYKKEDERFRRLDIAEGLKNIAITFKVAISTATQASFVPEELWDNPEWYMTRENVSECKGLVNPFSFFFSWNVTRDEYENNVGRIYTDKIRDHKGNHKVRIATDYAHNMFYDHSRTLQINKVL